MQKSYQFPQWLGLIKTILPTDTFHLIPLFPIKPAAIAIWVFTDIR